MPKRQKISYSQKALPFTGQGARAVQEPLRKEWRAVALAGGVVLFLAVVYGYGVVTSIAQVSMRESALAEVRTLSATRATLESQYLAKTSGITEEYARTLGYRSAGAKVFVAEPKALSYARDAR